MQLLAEDPFEKGWLIKVRLDQPPQTAELLDLDSYEKKVAEEAPLIHAFLLPLPEPTRRWLTKRIRPTTCE